MKQSLITKSKICSVLAVLGQGVSGPVFIKDGLALKILDLTDLDLENKYLLHNYKQISFPPPRNCEIEDPRYYINDQQFIPGINPWRELKLLEICRDIPGIVKYHKHEIIDDKLLLYTEIAGNQTFHDKLINKELTDEQISVIREKIKITVDELNSKGIIHMDLKPKNCVLDNNLEPTIVDFGWGMYKDFPMCKYEVEYFEKNKNNDLNNLDLFLNLCYK